MPDSTDTTQKLSLVEEFILILLNEQIGYFHQVRGWNLNCAVVGAALAELSLMGRIDTDPESRILVDATETGDAVLDPILKEIAEETVQRDAVYWIERLAGQAESIIDRTLDRLVELKVPEHHDGDFWTLAATTWHEELAGGPQQGTVGQFVRTRVLKVLLTDEIPGPRDIIVICLVNTCDVFRFMFDIDDETRERIDLICRMDMIGRSIAAAVEHNIASPMLRRPAFDVEQTDSRSSASPGAAEPAPAERQRACALLGSDREIRLGVPDPPALRQTHDLPRRAAGQCMGAPSRADALEGRGLFRRLREALRRARRVAVT